MTRRTEFDQQLRADGNTWSETASSDLVDGVMESLNDSRSIDMIPSARGTSWHRVAMPYAAVATIAAAWIGLLAWNPTPDVPDTPNDVPGIAVLPLDPNMMADRLDLDGVQTRVSEVAPSLGREIEAFAASLDAIDKGTRKRLPWVSLRPE